jgi:hypothetical protein
MALSNVAWKGSKAIAVMLNVLPDKIAGKKLSEAYRFALKPTLDKMKANLPPNRTAALWHATALSILGGKNSNTMFALVGPRRKRFVWNQQGWHAHLVEKGTKPHEITAGPGKLMPIFTKSGFTGQYAKTINHPGSRAFKPFQRSIDATWNIVGERVSDKVAEIMRDEIKLINVQYGQVVTRAGSVL